LAHLVEKFYKGDLRVAVAQALKMVEGSFALAVVSTRDPEMIVCARKDSPLIVAEGKDGMFIASDVPAILEEARRVVYLKDNQVAVLTRRGVEVYDLAGKRVPVKFDRITMGAESAAKGGYAHFMLKEIHEQPTVLRRLLSAGPRISRISSSSPAARPTTQALLANMSSRRWRASR
jgi:glucosamine--fructose-6-phosphate aminotransferase (isomerizing)